MSKPSSLIVHTSRTPCHEASQKRVKHWARMAVFDVRSHPRPPSVTSGHCYPAVAVRQPGYLPANSRRPIGFAPPPYDGFALLASAHTRMRCPASTFPMCLLCMHDIVDPSPTQYPSWRIFCVYGSGLRVASCHTLSLLMPALLPVDDGSALNH
jgi:hypothetical protein